jgi:uncharacterized protein
MATTVSDAPARERFELHDDGTLVGWLDYRPAGESVILAHTEVPEQFEGHGYGGTLVRGALEALAERDKTAIPTCPFVIAWLHRHPDFAGHVSKSLRRQFEAS